MKSILVLALAIGIASTSAFAGVSHIQNNGNISGVPSWSVSCSSGGSYVIYKKNGTWYRGDIGHMGNRYDSWSLDDVASFVCS
ncbi:hypothetical protein ACU6TU_13205 [Halomonas sp. LS-001]